MKYTEFDNPEDARKYFEDRYSEWLADIKKHVSQIEALNSYAGNTSYPINRYLEGKSGGTDEYLSKIIEDLKSAGGSAGKIGGKFILYRFINLNELQIIEKSSFCAPFIKQTFLSTSVTNTRARDEENEIFLKLYVSQNIIGVPIFLQIKERFWEQEFLIMPKIRIWPRGKKGIYEILLKTPTGEKIKRKMFDCYVAPINR